MNRRGFLGSILALGAAPAIVRADSLMRIIPRDELIILDLAPDDTPFTSTVSMRFTDFVVATFEKHHAEIRANITGHNAVYREFIKHKSAH